MIAEDTSDFPYTCWECGKPNDWSEDSCYECEIEGERQQEEI